MIPPMSCSHQTSISFRTEIAWMMSNVPAKSRRKLKTAASASNVFGDHLALRVRAVLADQHEGREENRLEGDDHGQQAVRILLDAEADPAGEPDDVDVDEQHRAAEVGDRVGDPVLRRLGSLTLVLEQRRIDGWRSSRSGRMNFWSCSLEIIARARC